MACMEEENRPLIIMHPDEFREHRSLLAQIIKTDKKDIMKTLTGNSIASRNQRNFRRLYFM